MWRSSRALSILTVVVCIAMIACGSDSDVQPTIAKRVDTAAAERTPCRYYGEIRAVRQTADGYVALVDFMVVLSDTLAMHALMDDGELSWCDRPYNDYHIVNSTERIDTLRIRDDASIHLLASLRDSVVDVRELPRILEGSPHFYGISAGLGVPGHLTIDDGVIVRFDQSYFP